jgi:glycosyltransferase involved in cell wall biosynthesis
MMATRANSAHPAVSVVIGTLNRRWHLKRALASVRAELPFPEAEIVVVDGGSDDGTLGWLAKQKDLVTIVQHNRGRWHGQPLPRRSWGSFMNLGFKAARAPHICMLSDDCLVVPGAIRSGLERLAREGDDVGAVAFYWRNWPEQERYWVGRTFGGGVFVNHGLFRGDALASVGFADEETFRFYYADGDLALRIADTGWKCLDSPTSFIEHYSHANLAQRAANLETREQDWAAYEGRWGHLGAPDTDWIELSHHDPHCTARRYWGARGLLTARANQLRTRLRGVPDGLRRRVRRARQLASPQDDGRRLG